MSLFQPAYLKNKVFSKSRTLQIQQNVYQNGKHQHTNQYQLNKKKIQVTPKHQNLSVASKSSIENPLSLSYDRKRFNRTADQYCQESQIKRSISRKSNDIYKKDRGNTEKNEQQLFQEQVQAIRYGYLPISFHNQISKQQQSQATVTSENTKMKSNVTILNDKFNLKKSSSNCSTSYLDKCQMLESLVEALQSANKKRQEGNDLLASSRPDLERTRVIRNNTQKGNENITRIKSSSQMQFSKLMSNQKALNIQQIPTTLQSRKDKESLKQYFSQLVDDVQLDCQSKISFDCTPRKNIYKGKILGLSNINSLKDGDQQQLQIRQNTIKQLEKQRVSQQHQLVSLKKTIEHMKKRQKQNEQQKEVTSKKQEIKNLTKENYKLKKQIQNLKIQNKTNTKRIEDQSQQILFLQKQVSQLNKHINKVMACKIPKDYMQLQSYRQASLQERLRRQSFQLKKSTSDKQKQLDEQNEYLKSELEKVRDERAKLQIAIRIHQKKSEQLNADKNAIKELSYLRPKYKKLDQQCKILKRNILRLKQDLQFERKRNRREKIRSSKQNYKQTIKNPYLDFSHSDSQQQQNYKPISQFTLKNNKYQCKRDGKSDKINEQEKTDDQEIIQLSFSMSR